MPPYRNYIYEYHAKIASGEIIAGKWIKKIYEIIINGLQKQEYFFNAKAANKAIRFIENFCHHSNATMKTGDVIEINTKYGSKGAKLIRDGVETDYFRYIDVDSTFMQLAIGDNMFRYDAASGVNSLEVSIFYSKEFLGV